MQTAGSRFGPSPRRRFVQELPMRHRTLLTLAIVASLAVPTAFGQGRGGDGGPTTGGHIPSQHMPSRPMPSPTADPGRIGRDTGQRAQELRSADRDTRTEFGAEQSTAARAQRRAPRPRQRRRSAHQSRYQNRCQGRRARGQPGQHHRSNPIRVRPGHLDPRASPGRGRGRGRCAQALRRRTIHRGQGARRNPQRSGQSRTRQITPTPDRVVTNPAPAGYVRTRRGRRAQFSATENRLRAGASAPSTAVTKHRA